jgi:hypothetical protein
MLVFRTFTEMYLAWMETTMTTNTENKPVLTQEVIEQVVKPFQDQLDKMGIASVVLVAEKEESTPQQLLAGASENFVDLDSSSVRALVKVAYKFVSRWEDKVFGNEDELEEACADN